MEIHSFRVDIATKYGIAEAILLGYFYHWIKVHEKNETNFYDGRYWTFDTVRGLVEKMPYFTRSTVHRAIKKLEENKLILTGNFNKLSYDKTTWYTLTDDGMLLFEPCPKMRQGLSQNGTTIPTYNEEKNNTLSQNETGLSQNGTTIPIQSTYSLDDEDDDYIKQTHPSNKVNQKIPIPGKKYSAEVYENACKIYEKFILPIPSMGIKESILACVDDFGLAEFEKAVKKAAKNNARSFSYIETVLINEEKEREKNGKNKIATERSTVSKKVKGGNRSGQRQTTRKLGPYI